MAHSAYGALVSDVNHSVERSILMHGGGGGAPLHEGLDKEAIEAGFARLEADCHAAMRRAKIDDGNVSMTRSVSLRYRRQTNGLSIELPAGRVTSTVLANVVEKFELTYEAIYGEGSGFSQAGIEITSLRVEAIGKTDRPPLRRTNPTARPAVTTRPLYEASVSRWIDASIFRWDGLPVDYVVEGPAIIEHPETAVFVAVDQIARLDGAGNIVIDVGGAK
jgi:N-methylhydantoinase A